MSFEVECSEPVMQDDFVENQNPEIVIQPGLFQPLNEYEGIANGADIPIRVTIRELYGKRLVTVYV